MEEEATTSSPETEIQKRDIINELLLIVKQLNDDKHELESKLKSKEDTARSEIEQLKEMMRDVNEKHFRIYSFYSPDNPTFDSPPPTLMTKEWKDRKADNPLVLLKSMLDTERELEGRFAQHLNIIDTRNLLKLVDITARMKYLMCMVLQERNKSTLTPENTFGEEEDGS